MPDMVVDVAWYEHATEPTTRQVLAATHEILSEALVCTGESGRC